MGYNKVMYVSTVKGIRYTYQIDYLNAEPTHLKSQVHQLPVVSAPQATALDSFQKQKDQYVPQRDTAVTYSAPSDARLSSPIARVADTAISNSLRNSTIPATEEALQGSSNVLAPNNVNRLLPESEVFGAEPVTEPSQIKLDVKTEELRPLEAVRPTLQTPIQNVRRGIATEQNPIFQDNGYRLDVTDNSNKVTEAGSINRTALNELGYGGQLNNNAKANSANTLYINETATAENAKPVPSYLIPGPDETEENSIIPKNFNRYLANQAKAVYGYISGAVSQLTSGSFNVLA